MTRAAATTERRGKLDLELFARFRATPAGPEKRRLLGQLLYENEPLAKLICAQFTMPSAEARKRGWRPMGGCEGFQDLDWQDAYQGALISVQKAIEQFNPEKGCWTSYVKQKMRHELQRLVFSGGSLVRVPRQKGKTVAPIPVALVGEQGDLDLLGGGYEDRELSAASGGGDEEILAEWDGAFAVSIDADGVSANDVTEWQKPAPPKRIIEDVPRVFQSGIEAFLSNRVVLSQAARVETWTAHNAYRLECRKHAFVEVARTHFVRWMQASGIREVFVRAAGRPSLRALAGIRLLGA